MLCYVMYSEFLLIGFWYEVVVDGVEFMVKVCVLWMFNCLEMVVLSFSGRILFCCWGFYDVDDELKFGKICVCFVCIGCDIWYGMVWNVRFVRLM